MSVHPLVSMIPFYFQLSVVIERGYGSREAVQIRYETVDGTAIASYDYQPVLRGAVTLSTGEKSTPVFIQVIIVVRNRFYKIKICL